MDFKWFLKESKSFMGYGKDISKPMFWVKFPGAYVKFLYYSVKG
jgi:hypothetical protein